MSSRDAVRKRVPAAINIVKLGLGDTVIDVDVREKELTLVRQPVHDSSHLGRLLGVHTNGILDVLQDALELRAG